MRNDSSVVDGKTRVLAVFGWPVEHTLSPAMQNAALAALNLPYIYVPFAVRPDQLQCALQAVRSLDIAGVNLTIPHKQTAVALMDWVDVEALAVGAVNTVVNRSGRLEGYNTDGAGFIAPLLQRGFNALSAQCVVVGTGGAARSAAYSLCSVGARVTVVGRSLARAEQVTGKMGDQCKPLQLQFDDYESWHTLLSKSSLLVNCTPVGMWPRADEVPVVPLSALHKALTVYDLIYNPQRTRLLQAAQELGATVVNGVEMLAHQGAAALQLFTGTVPDVSLMVSAVEEALDLQPHAPNCAV